MAGEKKRTVSESEEEMQDIQGVLVDIEGTTSSISFVKDELFPYVREFLKKHVDEKWDTEEFKEDFAKLKEQAKEDEANKVDGFVPIEEATVEKAKETLIKNVLWQMDNDRKAGALKSLQGHMWKAAHRPIKGHVYDDVPTAFKEWTDSGKKIYVYSSGSVLAQKLLFGDSVHGDLTKYLSNYFDTAIGHKQEVDSYKNILKEISLEPSKVLFLTDIVKEAEAAKKAGLSAVIVIREGNSELSDEEKVAFKTIKSFVELSFPKSQKRKKLEENDEEKKETSKEEKLATVVDKISESMDTSESTKVLEEKTTESTKDENVSESIIEKSVEEKDDSKKKTSENEKIEKMTTDEEKLAEKTEISVEKLNEKEAQTNNTEKENENQNDFVKDADTVVTDKSENLEKEEVAADNKTETEKVVQNSEKETKENGKSETDHSENKENLQNEEETSKPVEPEVEVAEEVKESNEVESEKETKLNGIKGQKTHNNGISEDGKQNGVTEESIKVKKVDGVEPDVASPTVVVA